MNFQWKWIRFQHKATSLALKKKKISKNLFQKKISKSYEHFKFSGLFFFFHLLFSFFINIHRNEGKKKKADENFLPLIFCSEYTNKRESERDEKIKKKWIFEQIYFIEHNKKREAFRLETTTKEMVMYQFDNDLWMEMIEFRFAWIFLSLKRCFSKKVSRWMSFWNQDRVQ